jgi:hypothetical protein
MIGRMAAVTAFMVEDEGPWQRVRPLWFENSVGS